jgi:proline-specific peptidase
MEVLKNGLLEELTINGVKQWIYARSENIENPVLLFLHGGPGFPGIAVAQSWQKGLENNFIVVQWDQRGAGKSYSSTIPQESMNINQFLSDLFEIVKILNNKFNCKKIYLMGHSWGAMLGMLAVNQKPELFHCFISVGQSVNFYGQLSSEARYSYLVEEAEKRNDLTVLENIKTNKGNTMVEYENVVKYGGAFYGKSNTNQLGNIFFNMNILYTDSEKQSILKGLEFSEITLWEEIYSINIMDKVSQISIPVLFICGKYDMLCPTPVTTKYYETLNAPQKDIIYFEKSAHFPFMEETECFCEVIINYVFNK